MPLPLPALIKQPAHIAAKTFAAQPQVKLAHRLPPASVVRVELPARARTDTRPAFPWNATNAAHMAAIAAEPQQQVAVGFKGNSARGWQDANLAPTFARRPKHATCLCPLREPWIIKAATLVRCDQWRAARGSPCHSGLWQQAKPSHDRKWPLGWRARRDSNPNL
jgi:hypothetical protein